MLRLALVTLLLLVGCTPIYDPCPYCGRYDCIYHEEYRYGN